jgi:hypothetical protein
VQQAGGAAEATGDREAHRSSVRALVAGDVRTVVTERRFCRKGGDWFHGRATTAADYWDFECVGQNLGDEQGVGGIVVTARNITARNDSSARTPRRPNASAARTARTCGSCRTRRSTRRA